MRLTVDRRAAAGPAGPSRWLGVVVVLLAGAGQRAADDPFPADSLRPGPRLGVHATWPVGGTPGHATSAGAWTSPHQDPSTRQVITQQRRLDLLRRFATSTEVPAKARAAACVLLLYAQPLTRILNLTAGTSPEMNTARPGRARRTPLTRGLSNNGTASGDSVAVRTRFAVPLADQAVGSSTSRTMA